MGAKRRQGFYQAVGQRIIARFGGQLGAVPDFLFGQLAVSGPLAESCITGGRLGFTGQPQLLGGFVAFGFLVMGQLELAMEAVQFDEIEFW